MTRLKYNALSAVLAADIDTVATAVTFAETLKEYGVTDIPAIASPDTLALYRAGEVMWVTAYDPVTLAATVLRGQEDSTAIAHTAADTASSPFKHGPTKEDAGGDGSSDGGLLAVTNYDPATQANVSSVSATYADVDATNLVVTFTAPASGKVLVVLACYVSSGTAGNAVGWNLRDGSGDIAGSNVTMARLGATSDEMFATYRRIFDGLTPGSTYTWKWGLARDVGTSGNASMNYGGALKGPAIMEVWAAPL